MYLVYLFCILYLVFQFLYLVLAKTIIEIQICLFFPNSHTHVTTEQKEQPNPKIRASPWKNSIHYYQSLEKGLLTQRRLWHLRHFLIFSNPSAIVSLFLLPLFSLLWLCLIFNLNTQNWNPSEFHSHSFLLLSLVKAFEGSELSNPLSSLLLLSTSLSSFFFFF